MALVLEDRVRETTSSTGTGPVTLTGAFSGFQPFSVIGDGNTTYYAIIDPTAGSWEVGIGTYTSSGNTLSRDTVLSSSNAGSLVSFAAGLKDVICTQPSERAVYLDSASNATIPGITLSGGTANGVAYLNGSKVLTTGSALTFDGTNLQVGGGASGAIVTINGNANGGSLRGQRSGANHWFMGDTASALGSGTGLINYVYGNDPFIWYNGSTSAEQMRLTSTGLGIGTSSPAYKLDVRNGILAVGNGTITGGFSYSTRVEMGAISNHNLGFITNNTTAMILDTPGNLGLGVAPSAWNSAYKALDIGNSFGIIGGSLSADLYYNAFLNSGGSFIYKATTSASAYSLAGGQHRWYTAPSGTAGNAISFTQAMTLDASGRLLVGRTTSPRGERLVVDSNGGDTAYNSVFMNSSTSSTVYSATTWTHGEASTAVGYVGVGGSAVGNLAFRNNFVIGTQTSSPLVFNTGDAERARIDFSGQFLLGKTAFNLTQNGFACTLGDSTFTIPSGNTLHVYDGPNGVYRFYVTSAGQIHATSTSISGISDRTLKENIRDLETGIAEVMALKPRRFDWKNGDAQNVAGFVAQEVEEVLPELVADYVYNKDEGGNEIVKKSLKMGDILPTLVKAIQEQQALIQTLTARVQALESN
jgi:hypothetical protein